MIPASDIPKGGWIDRRVPAALRPWLRLLRLDRPIGTWLLLLPGWWGLALAVPLGGGDAATAARLMWWGALFGSGALVMRGAGCIVNDIADRRIDARVARTADRPIASGAISVRAALKLLAVLLLIGLAIIAQFDGFAVALGAASLLLVFPYPLMKRITWWPQAWLGLTFNWGALLGWAAATGDLGWPAIALYAAGFFWTLGYDTIYAHQDKEDDALVGVRSSARWLGARTRPAIAIFYAFAMALLALAGELAGLGWGFWPGLALAALHLAGQARHTDFDDPKSCLAAFRANRYTGLIVLAAILAGGLS
ncbi:MAG: 4-hydroxybenzoate octaprenyltransferase [Alphaproteobacteria bacterium]|nr:4-hydroxybenzoate octaprenyltransferase [Alphaproteobacteria bacterium]